MKEIEDNLTNKTLVHIPDGYGEMKYVYLEDYMENTYRAKFEPFTDVKFLLYSRSNPKYAQQIIINNGFSLKISNFNASRPTQVIIHGFLNDANSNINVLTTAAYLKNKDVNVIVVDWAKAANTWNYISARYQMHGVAEIVAQFLDFLHISYPQANIWKTLTLVGFSLGAHCAGITGKNVRYGRISVIYGLDAAGPLFSLDNPLERLDRDDAQYVEVIHTNAGTLGFLDPIGHADFFVNGGTNQPGCNG